MNSKDLNKLDKIEREQWLKEKIDSFNKNPKNTLEYMLDNTTNIIEQYLEDPTIISIAVLKSCMVHNKMFLKLL